MSAFDVDLFVLGAGSGGVATARRAGAAGAKVAIAEARRVGGTCVLRGCIPKKLLVYAAQYGDALQDMAGYGWEVREATLDWGALLAAKRAELRRLEAVYEGMLERAGVELLRGHARLTGRHEVEVGGRTIRARDILVATGGRSWAPAIPGIEHAIDSEVALELPELPRSLLIVGGGYIALEFAGVFSALGVEVTVAVRSQHPLRGFDDELRVAATEALQARGVAVLGRAHVRAIRGEGAGAGVWTAGGEAVTLGSEGPAAITAGQGSPPPQAVDVEVEGEGIRTLVVDRVLLATGRVPSTDTLGLAALGVELDERGGVSVDAYSRTRIPSIWAIGDATNRIALTPVAIAEGIALVRTLVRGEPTAVDHEQVPSAVFGAPPIAAVGMTEAAARRRFGDDVDVYASRFTPQRHQLTGRAGKTLIKLVVVRSTGHVVGAHMIGDDAPEIIQGVAIAMKAGATKAHFDATMAIHPTSAEELVLLREPRPRG